MTTLAATPALDTPSFEYVRKLVLDRSAISLEPGKGYLVESRLMPIARAHGHGTLTTFIDSLRRQPSGPLHTQVVEAMTTRMMNGMYSSSAVCTTSPPAVAGP